MQSHDFVTFHGWRLFDDWKMSRTQFLDQLRPWRLVFDQDESCFMKAREFEDGTLDRMWDDQLGWMRKKNRTPAWFTRLYATVCQEEGAFTVTVRLLNHRNQSQVAWGEEIAETVEVASSMIGALAREFSIAEKYIAIELRMASLKEGTLHWRAEYEGKPTTTIHRAVQLLQGRVQALWELRGSAVPYFKELDPVVAAFSEPGIGVLSWREWMFEKQTAFGSAMHSDHISSIGVSIKRCVYMATGQETVARLLRLRPIASVDILHVCESNGSILFTSVVEVEGASCQEDKPTIEILGDGWAVCCHE
jgi:hypothetical protein